MHTRKFKRILGNGLLIAIPLGILLYILMRLVAAMEILIQPVATALHIQRILGELTLTILAVFVMILIVISLGLLMQLPFVAAVGRQLESIALRIFPSLNEIKLLTADKLNFDNKTDQWKPVLLCYEEKYSPAYIVEEDDRMVSLFVLKGAALSEGELLITERSKVRMEPVSAGLLHQFSRQYGKGFLALLREKGYMQDVQAPDRG